MHKLDRSKAPHPVCLGNYSYPNQTWDDLARPDYIEIRTSLFSIQGFRCAYCEGGVYLDGHVEHFRRKNPNHFPALTFDWGNLFFACGSKKHCGHYKDRSNGDPYNPNDVIKPDIEDPSDFLHFQSLGTVEPRSDITGDNKEQLLHRATETIRVFNLDCGALRQERRRAIQLYKNRDKQFFEDLSLFTDDERRAIIEDEIRATAEENYATAIRHFLEKL